MAPGRRIGHEPSRHGHGVGHQDLGLRGEVGLAVGPQRHGGPYHAVPSLIGHGERVAARRCLGDDLAGGDGVVQTGDAEHDPLQAVLPPGPERMRDSLALGRLCDPVVVEVGQVPFPEPVGVGPDRRRVEWSAAHGDGLGGKGAPLHRVGGEGIGGPELSSPGPRWCHRAR